MVIKNKQTRKEYPVSKDQWAAYPERVKDLFTIVDDSELKNPQSQPIKNVVTKQEPKIKQVSPNTGNKKSENSNHKK